MNAVVPRQRFGEFGAEMCAQQRCLCCEAAFGCKTELFDHLKTKHWPTVFDVLMMGPTSDPVGRWIDDMLSSKCAYDDASMPDNEETLPVSVDRERIESSGANIA